MYHYFYMHHITLCIIISSALPRRWAAKVFSGLRPDADFISEHQYYQ